MAQVICTLPNASEEISGVAFTAHESGMISAEISDELAADFASIRGYQLVGDEAAPVREDADLSDLSDLTAKATALGIDVKKAWGASRIKAEIGRAEAATA